MIVPFVETSILALVPGKVKTVPFASEVTFGWIPVLARS